MTAMPSSSTPAAPGATEQTISTDSILPNGDATSSGSQSTSAPPLASSASGSRPTTPQSADQTPAHSQTSSTTNAILTQLTSEKISATAQTVWKWLNGRTFKWLVGAFTTICVAVGVYFGVDAKRNSDLTRKDQALATCISIFENGLALSTDCKQALATTGEHSFRKRGTNVGECAECPTCLIGMADMKALIRFLMVISPFALTYVLVPIRRVYEVEWKERGFLEAQQIHEVEADISNVTKTYHQRDRREPQGAAFSPGYSYKSYYNWTKILMTIATATFMTFSIEATRFKTVALVVLRLLWLKVMGYETAEMLVIGRTRTKQSLHSKLLQFSLTEARHPLALDPYLQ